MDFAEVGSESLSAVDHRLGIAMALAAKLADLKESLDGGFISRAEYQQAKGSLLRAFSSAVDADSPRSAADSSLARSPASPPRSPSALGHSDAAIADLARLLAQNEDELRRVNAELQAGVDGAARRRLLQQRQRAALELAPPRSVLTRAPNGKPLGVC